MTVLVLQIVTSASTDLQDYTYYFVPAPWLSVKLLRLLQCYPPPGKVIATTLLSHFAYAGEKPFALKQHMFAERERERFK